MESKIIQNNDLTRSSNILYHIITILIDIKVLIDLLLMSKNGYRPIRLNRSLLLLVTAGWTLFTVAFIPLHTRGAIQLDRQNIPKVTKPSCCCEGEAKTNRVAASSSDTKKSEQPKPLRQGSCAVCFLIAQLSTPADDADSGFDPG